MAVKVLFVCSNHPALHPGETETYALQLYEQMRESPEVESVFLARTGIEPIDPGFRPHPGTPFGLFGADEGQHWVFTEAADFDWLHLSARHNGLVTTYLRDFLLAHRPDVIHIHDLLYLGLDLLPQIKNTLPEVAIVHALHGYRPICHRDGVMVRTRNDELCDHYSPRRCHECFPDIAPSAFFMRKRLIESRLRLVDLFLAPSRFLMERYVEWGIPRAKIRLSEQGLPGAASTDAEPAETRNRLGFFGRLDRHGGVSVLLEAIKVLASEEQSGDSSGRPDVQLTVHGPMTATDWVVVPSLWWESSALVVQDAFRHGKPVIASRIGALEEKVTHGVNGLHFRRGDPQSLAGAIRLAVTSPGLWQALRDGIPPVRSIAEDAQSLIDTYRELTETELVASLR